MENIQNIPRFYTALAEWGACMTIVAILWKSEKKKWVYLVSCILLIWQSFFLIMTGEILGVGWAGCMFVAALSMFLFLWMFLQKNIKQALYFVSAAFVMAEFAASFEWQLATYLWEIGIPGIRCWQYVLLFLIYGIFFVSVYHFEKRILTKEMILSISMRESVSMLLLALLVFVFSNLSYLSKTPFSSSVPFDIFIIRTLVDMIGICIFGIYQSTYHDFLISKELEQIQLVLDRQYNEYRTLQDNIEQLHIMRHDLKHQIQALRKIESYEEREKWIREMEEELDASGFKVVTGNPVLDNILQMKFQMAKKWNIHFTCIAEGSLLEFMHVRDICTLFGNAIDNAIESVMLIPEEEKRLIQMNVSRQKNMVCILIRNYTENELKKKNEGFFPKTTKADKKNHGFGLKSISYCIKKYNGTMSVSQEQKWFQLMILIPLEMNK